MKFESEPKWIIDPNYKQIACWMPKEKLILNPNFKGYVTN